MTASYGKITAHLAEPIDRITEDLVSLINLNINPPQPVGADDIYVRTMFVVSDEVNSFGGRFPADEHARLASLLIDSPVLVGHRKDKLPVGRNFYTTLISKDGRQWVKSYFYWLKAASGGESLRENIDGGIYKECSIAFTYLFPECSVCGSDIRRCEHQPLQNIVSDGSESTVHYNYRQIERVLETSLVYRGALPDTSISKELNSADPGIPIKITDLCEIDQSPAYLVTPCYEALQVLVRYEGNELSIRRLDGTNLDYASKEFQGAKKLSNFPECFAHLIGHRGKQRCDLALLEKFNSGKTSSITHLELKLFPNHYVKMPEHDIVCNGHRINSIRHALCRYDELNDAASALATRNGVLIWPIANCPPVFAGYNYRPQLENPGGATYQLSQGGAGDGVKLIVSDKENSRTFQIKQFNLNRLKHGARFVAEKMTDNGWPSNSARAEAAVQIISKGRIASVSKSDDGFLLQLKGGLEGIFVIQAIRLDGQKKFLFFKRECRDDLVRPILHSHVNSGISQITLL